MTITYEGGGVLSYTVTPLDQGPAPLPAAAKLWKVYTTWLQRFNQFLPTVGTAIALGAAAGSAAGSGGVSSDGTVPAPVGGPGLPGEEDD